MSNYNIEISSLTLANTILDECFKYDQTRKSTTAYDLCQYITILDAYLQEHHKGSQDYYMYMNNMWVPVIIQQKFSGLNMNEPILHYIPRAGEKAPMVQDPQVIALASYVVTTFFHMNPVEKNDWINNHCLFSQVDQGYNAFLLKSRNLSII